ncbi:protein of unknown function [Methylorubrum extorquens]|uniref:Uncharacterized protein n=1 Tax=Methylorubrum extorquens TaxID=408 RepID=A0A2N9AVI2_METEX|nr:protein of unknown function [Methylorubrum extorquens]
MGRTYVHNDVSLFSVRAPHVL